MEHWLSQAARRAQLPAAGFLSIDAGATTAAAWETTSRELGIVQEALAARVAPALRMRCADLSAADRVAHALLPERLARLHAVAVVRADARTITIATSDPTDVTAEQAISFATGRRVVFELAAPAIIAEAVARAYQANMQSPTLRDLADAIVALTSRIIEDAVGAGASDIHIEPGPVEGTIRFRVDGVLRQYVQMEMDALNRVVSRIKVLAKLDIADRTRPQDGRTRLNVGRANYDVRVSTVPTRDSEKAVIRLLRPDATVSLEGTGMARRERGLLRQLLGFREGIVLVTGPTGSGKTTTLYAALSEIAQRDVNITTVEDPIEYELPGITQVQVEPKRGVTFASALRAILRQDPDVMLVGEIRDRETAEIALRASLTGHLVLATLHTNDSLSAITRLHDLGLDRASIAASLRGSLAQRLVRKLCTSCAEPVGDVLTAEEQRLTSGYGVRPVMRATGCSECGNSGYRGRLPIVEIAVSNQDLAELIASDASASSLHASAVAGGMRSLHDAAIDRVLAGETTLQEVDRVVGSAPRETPDIGAVNSTGRVRRGSDEVRLRDSASQLFSDIGLTGWAIERTFRPERNARAG